MSLRCVTTIRAGSDSAASVAIRAATAGRFVLDASEREGGAPVPASGPLLVVAGPRPAW